MNVKRYGEYVWLDKEEGEWKLWIQLPVAENEGLADDFTDADQILALARNLVDAANELQTRRAYDPAKCDACGSTDVPYIDWFEYNWCQACYDDFNKLESQQVTLWSDGVTPVRRTHEETMAFMNGYIERRRAQK